MPIKYSVSITFETDRELTESEIEDLEGALYLPIYEPADRRGDAVEYRVASQTLNTRKGAK